MSDKDSAQNVINAYRKRQQAARRAPVIIGISIAALVLIIGGGILLFVSMGSNNPVTAILATETPTPTDTATPTVTFTATATPTQTPEPTITPTATITPTVSGPFIYQVEQDDTLWSISQKFSVDLLVLITVNNLDPAVPDIRVGDKLIIPAPDTALPSPTPLPTGIRKGTKIEYQVQLGDSLLSIAIQFNSTVEEIKKENKIENENQIFVGQKIIVPVNLVTPVPTPTITPTVDLTLFGTPLVTPPTLGAPAPSATP